MTGSGILLRTSRGLWLLLVVLIVLAALLTAAVRLAMLAAPEFQGRIERSVSELIGQTVRAKGFGLRMRGLYPHLVLDEVVVESDGRRAAVVLDRVELLLDLPASLRNRHPAVRELILDSPDLVLQRRLTGEFGVPGVEPRRDVIAVINALLDGYLLQQTTVRINNARIAYEDPGRAQLYRFHDIDLRLVARDEGGRQLAGQVPLPPELGEALGFIVEWGDSGQPLEDDVLRFYASGRGVTSRLVEHFLGAPGAAPPVALRGDVEIWGTLQGGLPVIGPQRSDGRRAVDLTVRATGGALDMPALFRAPIPFDSVDAEARWRGDGQSWQLDLDALRVRNEDADIDAAVRMAREGDAPLFLDVRGGITGESGNMARTSRYLPAAVMHPRLVEWLDRSLLDGTATRAEVLYFGHVNAFPFDGGEGRFAVSAEVRDAMLAFHPDWPPLTELDGTLRFRNRGMEIGVDSGSIGGARLLQAEAAISRFGAEPLLISGLFQGEGGELLRFLRDMPVMPGPVASIVDRFALDGEHGVELALTIPFRGLPLELDGAVRLDEGRLRFPERGIALDDLDGEIRFNRRGLAADGLQATLAGARTRLDIDTEDTESGSRIDLLADIRGLAAKTVAEQVPALDFLDGETDFQLEFAFPGFAGPPANPPIRMRLQSDLRGISSNLPAPGHKSSDEVLPLDLAMDIGAQPGNLRFDVGDRIAGVIGWSSEGRPRRFGIGLGERAFLPAERGLQVSGHAESIDLDGWLNWRRSGEEATADAESSALPLRLLDLDIGVLHHRGMALPNVSLYGIRSNGLWEFNLGGPSIAGTLRWQEGPIPRLRGQLQHVVLAGLASRPSATEEDDGRRPLSPKDWPIVDLDVTRLTIAGHDLGRLQVLGEPLAPGYRIESVRVEAPDLLLEAQGEWQDDGGDGATMITARARSDRMGSALRRLGYADFMAGGSLRARADLRWPGSPVAVDADRFRGNLTVNVRDGRLTTVDPGAGRVLGLLSVATIPRRLSLNFSDLVDEGFVFDRIRGKFTFDDGVATPEELWMDGPVARIEADGPIDLGDRVYDQTVTIIPRSSAALSLLGGLIAGPPGVVALLLAQTVFSDSLDRATRFSYHLSGPWESPDLKRISRQRDDDGMSRMPTVDVNSTTQ